MMRYKFHIFLLACLAFGLVLRLIAGAAAFYGLVEALFPFWKRITWVAIALVISDDFVHDRYAAFFKFLNDLLTPSHPASGAGYANRSRSGHSGAPGTNANGFSGRDASGPCPAQKEWEPMFRPYREEEIGYNGEFDLNDEVRAQMEDMQQLQSEDPNFNPYEHGYDHDVISDAYNDGYLERKGNEWEEW